MNGIKFISLYNYICFLVAVGLIIYWIYVFYLDEDLCVVDYKKYHEDELDLYPTISLCLQDSISESKLRLLNPKVNKSTYLKFLKGEFFDVDMRKLEYRNAAMDMNDFAVIEYLGFRNGSYVNHSLFQNSRRIFSITYTGFICLDTCLERLYNCYTVNLPQDRDIKTYGILLDNDIFPNGKRTPMYSTIAALHYPNQLSLSSKTLKFSWLVRKKYENFGMNFWIKNAEVMRRRNKRTKPCHEDWENYDHAVLVNHIHKIGCRSPYHDPALSVPVCNSSTTIRKNLQTLNGENYGIHPPCKAMEKVHYIYDEPSFKGTKWDTGKDRFWIEIHLYDNQFKYILKTRYTMATLLILHSFYENEISHPYHIQLIIIL